MEHLRNMEYGRQTINIGVDVGNYDTKTSNTTTPSGFTAYSEKPFLTDDVIIFNGIYYTPNLTERFSYVKDKTVDQNCFILTLFAIAKEILVIVKERKCLNGIQAELSEIGTINLGVGLPPTHLQKLSKPLQNYYKEKFGNGITFFYKEYQFRLKLDKCIVYPQDFAAILAQYQRNKKKESLNVCDSTSSIINYFKGYYAVDIGGYTVDVIPIHKKRKERDVAENIYPDVSKCASRELGVLRMYDQMIPKIEMETGIAIEPDNIEAILKKEPTILSENVINMVNTLAESWFNGIINQLRQAGLEFNQTPVVFIGGGALLFKKYIKKCPMLIKYEIIPGSRANADAYKYLMDCTINVRKAGA